MRVTDHLAQMMMGVLLSADCYVSLHTDDPIPDDPTASEVSGASYYRAPVIWVPQGRGLASSDVLSWGVLDTTSIAALGVFDAETGGNLLLSAVMQTPLGVYSRGRYELPAGGLYLTLT